MMVKRTKQQLLCAAGLVTLSMVSAIAHAQSAEYRRGYDQGYRDGLEAQRRQQHHSQSRLPIEIEDAQYGVRGASCDARTQIQQAVGWRQHVSIAVNNNLCGDPVPGVQKRLRLTYRCNNGEVFEVRGPEGGAITLDCR
ncbi:hypothetical protein [Noviherbaspirillum aerium]|uniref:hypothetical protein n=1 Tax=Noviherbaspirillum aerium TaxID=2588497 RepID=UPI00124F1503|nr:hypothetical protein [Noviherbaspirillum aerium]